MKQKVAIIGGGVSGVTLALLIQDKYAVTIFERDEKLLTKLLKTGNGRANIYNRGIKPIHYNDPVFIKEHALLIESKLDDFFASINVLTMTDEAGRVYPYSESAKAVREELVKRLNCKVNLNANVNEIQIVDDNYLVNGEEFNYLVLALGSSAGLLKLPLHNNNDQLLQSLALVRTPLVPVIKTIKVKENLKVLTNQKAKARVSLLENGKLVISDDGEVLFKEEGISGIVSFVISSYFEWAKEKSPLSEFKLEINLMPEYPENEAVAILDKIGYDGVFPEKVVTYLNSVQKKKSPLIPLTPVSGNRSENTQVIHGGIKVGDITDTFSFKKNPTLFALGEVLNIDGICGGYNLGFAFYSAIRASEEILNKLST